VITVRIHGRRNARWQSIDDVGQHQLMNDDVGGGATVA
jgi:hypothetical protein